MSNHQNYVTSPYSAIVNGKETGLAGCGTTSCKLRAYCLRADPVLVQMWTPEPEGCRFLIPIDCLQR